MITIIILDNDVIYISHITTIEIYNPAFMAKGQSMELSKVGLPSSFHRMPAQNEKAGVEVHTSSALAAPWS